MDEFVKQKADKFIAYMIDSGNKSDPDTIRQAILYGMRIGFDIFKQDIIKSVNEIKLDRN